MIIEIKASGIRQRYRFTLKGDNGEIVAQSEKYRNRKDCFDTVTMIMQEAAEANVRDMTGNSNL